MSLMPLPHFKTLYLHFDQKAVTLTQDSPSIGQLGRFHFTATEISRLERAERFKIKEENKTMAFQMIDVSTLPVRELGRKASEPRVVISEQGRFQFNVLIQKAWEEVGKLIVQYDGDNRLLAFRGFKLEDKVKGVADTAFLKVTKGKKDGSLSASGAGILTKIGYDYATAGNQGFDAKFDEKLKAFIVAIPATTPARKPVQVRKKKTALAGMVATANGVNGAVQTPPPVVVPEEGELLEIS